MRNLYFVLLLFGVSLHAQITVDGRYDAATETDYQLLESIPVASTGFGPYGIFELRAFADTEHLYLNVLGTPEANFNKVVLYIDVVSNPNGINSGTILPVPSTGFYTGQATLDVPNTDFAIVYGGGNSPYEGFTNLITYASGSASDEFQTTGGPITGDGTASSFTGTALDGGQVAYTAVADINARSGDEALEFEIDLADLGITAATDFHIFAAYTNGNGDFWSDNTLPIVPGATGNFGGDLDFTAKTGQQYTTYAIEFLPVSYLSFSARSVSKAVVLDWVTSSEEDNEGFAVERSTSGTGFTEIGWVSARTTGRGNATYSYTDEDVSAGQTYFYRLRQRDYDGDEEYGAVVAVTTTMNPASLLVYPNPAAPGSARLLYQSASDQEVTVVMYGASGQRISEQRTRVSNGTNDLLLPTSGLKPGLYVVQLRDDQGQVSTHLSVR